MDIPVWINDTFSLNRSIALQNIKSNNIYLNINMHDELRFEAYYLYQTEFQNWVTSWSDHLYYPIAQ